MVLAQLISSLIAVAAKILQTSRAGYGALDTRQVRRTKRAELEIALRLSADSDKGPHNHDGCYGRVELALDVLDKSAGSALWPEESMAAVDPSRHSWCLW